jgi:putative ABC transport system permease protein
MRRALRLPFSRSRLAREIDDEIAFHLATRVDQLVAGGMTMDDAKRQAMRQFGDVDVVRQGMFTLSRQREAALHRASLMSDLRQDLVFGIRTLWRSAAFTLLVVGGLALGIGANATIFTLIEALLIRQLPVERPDQLVVVGDPQHVNAVGCCTPMAASFSYPLYLDVREHNPVFTGVLAAGGVGRLDVRIEREVAEPEHPRGRFVSGNYFSVLGVRALIGGTLNANDDAQGAAPRATISHRYWLRRFEGDPSIVGRTITVNGIGVVVTGVAPPGFAGEAVGAETEVWLPIAAYDVLRPNVNRLSDRSTSWLLLIGRAKPGLALAQVKERLVPVIESSIMANATAAQRLRLEKRGLTYYVSSGARGLSSVRPDFAAPLVALMIGVAMLLGVVCVNVANLLLARGVARGREMSLRLAIGANRFRIFRQLVTEGLLLALTSAAAAVLVGWWGSRAMLALASEGNPLSLEIGPNGIVVAFTIGLSVVSVLLFGLVPALRSSRVDLATALRAQSRSIARGARFGAWLIAAQVAVSVILVAGAATLSSSLRDVESTDLGFDRDHLIVADLDIVTPGYTGELLAARVHALRDRILAQPGVAAVTYSENGLFSGTDWSTSLVVPGFTVRSEEDSTVASDQVGAGYAQAIGGRIIAGRDLVPADEGVLPRVGVVNASFARFYFPRGNAVGQFVRFDDSVRLQIVGVMSDTRGQSLEPPTDHRARRVYVPYLHAIDPGNIGQPEELRLLVRTRGAPEALTESVRRVIVSFDAALPLDQIHPLSALVRTSIRHERLLARVATALGFVALALAALGLYGVAAYTTAQRTNEFGVRVALGARAADVARMVLRDVLRPVAFGAALGAPVAFTVMRAMQRHLTAVTSDPASVAIALVIMTASAAIAGVVPALHAARTDPTVALRSD